MLEQKAERNSMPNRHRRASEAAKAAHNNVVPSRDGVNPELTGDGSTNKVCVIC